MNRFCRALSGLFALALLLSPSLLHARTAPDSFADLAEKLIPSVVNISTKQTIVQDRALQDFMFQFPPGSPFEDFFREFQERRGLPGPAPSPSPDSRGIQPRTQKVTSLGSGFVVDPRGYIVTNLHVIQDADEISVNLHDDTSLKAKIIGRDTKTDLAVLKVETKTPLTVARFGDSDKTRVGEWILAIGNPFGLGGTVTTGIISARARDINSGPYDDYLQTDAPINRGNSGGPMFNMSGEVIGVNTAIFSPSGGSVGIGFAIPSSIAQTVVKQLIEHGSIRRGWLGVRIQAVTPDIAKGLGLDKPEGALVSSLTDDGPASAAGIKTGDVIIEFDGKHVTEMHRLPRIVAETPTDKTVSVVVIRQGKRLTLPVKIGLLDHDEADSSKKTDGEGAAPLDNSTPVDDLGINVLPVTQALRTKYELSKDVNGLLIVEVRRDGLASDHGLLVGDMIVQAAQSEVKQPQDLIMIAAQHKRQNKPLLLLIDRRGDLRFVAVSFEK